MKNQKAIILLSGGIDSATCLAMAVKQYFQVYCLTFNYGQRHSIEIECARKIAQGFAVKEHKIMHINLRQIGGSALTDEIPVPHNRELLLMHKNIPVTYVPARNTIFLSYALAWAEVVQIGDIFIGVNAVDFSGYPDCRPAYIKKFEELANLATKIAIEGIVRFVIHTPLIKLTKADIIKTAKTLGIDLSLTHSCYDPSPDGSACGVCDSCLLRLKGFSEAGSKDPILYCYKK